MKYKRLGDLPVDIGLIPRGVSGAGMMRDKRDRNSGFTLVEALTVVAILVILLSGSAVGVARSRDYLKITELDNAAWEIYMAAQNRAVLLQNSGRLGPSAKLLESIGPNPSGPTILSDTSASDALDELLPVGSIDPSLREGHFHVLYDKDTGHVIEVFYAGEEIEDDKLDSFRKSPSDRISEFRNGTTTQLVGHYDGAKAEVTGTRPLPAPGVEVLIGNGEELTLNVKYTLPDGLPDGVVCTPTVQLKYDGKGPEDLTTSPRCSKTGSFGSGRSVTYTWVLDSLEESMRFKDLSSDFTDLGGDFTVTAGLRLSAEGHISSAHYATGTDNSLFAQDSTYNSTDGTARIANLRHLQNLCTDFSGVGGGVVKAEQLVNIDFNAERPSAAYQFVPIVNGSLRSYDGQEREIQDLRVEADNDAGLFGEAACADMSISGVRLVAPEVISRMGNAGGLVGQISKKCMISDCRVYWKDPRELVSGAEYSYKIKAGQSAGGLVGAVNANVTIKNSFAAATVSGRAGGGSGGLIGSVDLGPAEIAHSYANCYLDAGGGSAGGLVGANNDSSSPVRLKNCYTAGFIIESGTGGKTGGLVGNGKATANGVYSVVRVVKDGALKRPQQLLAQDLNNSAGVRYLFTAAEADGAPFNALPFKTVETEATHVYNLRHKTSSADKCVPPYPFPGLRDLPHYGDWAELTVPVGLAYYEQYTDGAGAVSFGFDGTVLQKAEDGTDAAAPIGSGSLKDGLTVTKDGYALAVKTEDLENLTNARIIYGESGGQTWTLTPPGDIAGTEWTWTDGASANASAMAVTVADHTLIPLPDAVVAGTFPTSDFYQKLTVQVNIGPAASGGSGGDSKVYYFNPHFAKTVRGQNPGEPSGEGTSAISVRTPRHLYDLTRRYDGSSYYYRKEFYFKQELDLDYSSYRFTTETGSSLTAPTGSTLYYQQPLIGTDTAPFKGTYDGGGHPIRNVAAIETGTGAEAHSLFVLPSDDSGKVIDIDYTLPDSSPDLGP